MEIPSASFNASPSPIDAFIERWDGTGLAERANCQPFLSELCDVLGVPRPDPATGSAGAYRFERPVTHHEADGTTARRIDLYRRDRFILEAKQGAAAPRTQSTRFPTFLLPGLDEVQQRANVRNSPSWARHMLAAKGQPGIRTSLFGVLRGGPLCR